MVYGINTGFGNFANKIIPKADLETLQKNLIVSHAVGVGNPLNHHQVRALPPLEDQHPRQREIWHQLDNSSEADQCLQ